MKQPFLPMLAGGLFAIALPLAPLSAQAGAPKSHGPNIEERLNKMKASLALTDDQVAKLKTVFEEQKAKLDPIFNDTSLSRQQKSEKARPISDETKARVDAVLTDEQKTKLAQIRSDRKTKKQEKKEKKNQ